MKSKEQFTLEHQSKAIDQYFDQLIIVAKNVVKNLEGYKAKANDQGYIRNSGKEKVVQWAMNMLQHISWCFDDGADMAVKYAVAKLAKEFAEKQNEIKK